MVLHSYHAQMVILSRIAMSKRSVALVLALAMVLGLMGILFRLTSSQTAAIGLGPRVFVSLGVPQVLIGIPFKGIRLLTRRIEELTYLGDLIHLMVSVP